MSSVHKEIQRFCRKSLLPLHKNKAPTNHHLTHLRSPLFSPLFILPSPFHHSITPLPPSSFCFCVFLFLGAVGLLFMASAVEDALLYKTLEPSKRPTPFEDVAHNSYLGLQACSVIVWTGLGLQWTCCLFCLCLCLDQILPPISSFRMSYLSFVGSCFSCHKKTAIRHFDLNDCLIQLSSLILLKRWLCFCVQLFQGVLFVLLILRKPCCLQCVQPLSVSVCLEEAFQGILVVVFLLIVGVVSF